LLADVVHRVRAAAAFGPGDAIMASVTGIRRHAVVMRVLFVVAHDPRLAGLLAIRSTHLSTRWCVVFHGFCSDAPVSTDWSPSRLV